MLLEMINRARANPAAEGRWLKSINDKDVKNAYKYFKVNLAKMASEFANLPSAPPLAMSSSLTSAARAHSRNMLNRNFQGHVGSDGANLNQRVARAGYDGSYVGENVYAYAESALYAHVGFQVDWGTGANGMQAGRGHRQTTHNGQMREIGVGVIKGSVKNGVGPMLVTEIFGTVDGQSQPFILGVVYDDRNKNGSYDRGEGTGEVEVVVEGEDYYTTTKAAGGYAVPVSGDGYYTMRFTLPNGSVIEEEASVQNNQNTKVDLEIGVKPPVISGDRNPFVGQATPYTFTTTEGAIGYAISTYRANTRPRTLNGESGMRGIRYKGRGRYRTVQSRMVHRGKASYHLAGARRAGEVMELSHEYVISGSSELVFSSCIGKATSNQMAMVQVSNDDGQTWQRAWSRKGRNGRAQTRFSTVRVKLGKFRNQIVKIRFIYRHKGGRAVRSTKASSGWLFDNIKFRNIDQLTDKETATTTGTEYLFEPESTGRYYHVAGAIMPNQTVVTGPPFRVDAR